MTFSTVEEWANLSNTLGITKLHLGCGSKYLPGWCNIDAHPSKPNETHRGLREIDPDIWADILRIPAESSSVDVVFSSHVVEHFYRHKAIHLFEEIWRVLKPGGYVITEMPDLNRILLLLSLLPIPPRYPKESNANRDIIKAQLYGAAWEHNDEGYQCHKYVWERQEFCEVLQSIGFKVILSTGATHTHVPFRDMAVVCMKPVGSSNGTLSNATLHDVLSTYGGKVYRVRKQISSLVNLIKRSVCH